MPDKPTQEIATEATPKPTPTKTKKKAPKEDPRGVPVKHRGFTFYVKG